MSRVKRLRTGNHIFPRLCGKMWFNDTMRQQTHLPLSFIIVAILAWALIACGPATPLPLRTTTAGPATATLTPTPRPSPTVAPAVSPTPPPDALSKALDTLEAQVRAVQGVANAPQIARQRLQPDALMKQIAARPLCPLPDTLAWQAFDLLPADTGETTVAVSDEYAQAFFDPGEMTIYYTAPEGITPALQQAYVRAYARALQFHTHAMPPAGANADRCLAQQALDMGAATYTTYLWFFAYATEAASPVATATPNAPSTTLPLAVVKYRDFPIDMGFNFVYTLSQKNGWQSINNALSAPPISTEQVLHPERYPLDQPLEVTLPDPETFAAALGAGWEAKGRGILGEAQLHLMLTASLHEEARLMADDAADATEGWGGGEWVVLYNTDTDEVALLAEVRWDTGPDAVAFVKAFVRYARGRFGPLDDRAYRVLFWESDKEAAVLRYNSGDQRTVWAFAPTRAQADALLAVVQAPGIGDN